MAEYSAAEHKRFSKTHKLTKVSRLPELINDKGQLSAPARAVPKEVYLREVEPTPELERRGTFVELRLPGGTKVDGFEKVLRKGATLTGDHHRNETSAVNKEAPLTQFLYSIMSPHGITTSRPLYIRKKGGALLMCTEKLPGEPYHLALNADERHRLGEGVPSGYTNEDHEAIFKKVGAFLAVMHHNGLVPIEHNPWHTLVEKDDSGNLHVGFLDFGEYARAKSNKDSEFYFDGQYNAFIAPWTRLIETFGQDFADRLRKVAKGAFRTKIAELGGIDVEKES